MKRCSSILGILMCILTISVSAQKVAEEVKIEPAVIDVLYRRTKVTDTLHVDTDIKIDYLTLRAGTKSSSFYSASRKTHDSISSRNTQYVLANMMDKEAFRKSSEWETEVIFKNYPEGKITNFTSHSLCNWRYEEDLVKPVWTMTDSVSTIGKYESVLAVTDYRGRRWFAWFTPEIAVSEGPWKLCGLPGLILDAFDDRGHYHFTAMNITLNPTGDVEYFNYRDRWKTDRITSLKNHRKYLQESVKNMILSSGRYGLDSKRHKLEQEDRSKPRTGSNYDFEETDYPHDKLPWEK